MTYLTSWTQRHGHSCRWWYDTLLVVCHLALTVESDWAHAACIVTRGLRVLVLGCDIDGRQFLLVKLDILKDPLHVIAIIFVISVFER